MVTILVVCTGNIRRSPAIEAILRQGTDAAPGLAEAGVTVVSAGTEALVGEGIDGPVASELAKLGVDGSSHVARQLRAKHIRQADIVLAAERAHRSAVVRLVPAAVRYTFTVLELAALGQRVGRSAVGGSDVATRLMNLVELAPRERAARVVRKAKVDDLRDLKRASNRDVARFLTELRAPAETLLRLVEPDSVLSIVGSEPKSEADIRSTVRLPLR
nr:low molecular weight phosphatase family protein [Nocardioides terrae]